MCASLWNFTCIFSSKSSMLACSAAAIGLVFLFSEATMLCEDVHVSALKCMPPLYLPTEFPSVNKRIPLAYALGSHATWGDY